VQHVGECNVQHEGECVLHEGECAMCNMRKSVQRVYRECAMCNMRESVCSMWESVRCSLVTSFICTLFSNLKVRVGVHTQVRPYASKPVRKYEPPAFFLSGHSSLSSSITGIENHWPLAETLLISTPSPPALRYTGKREQQNGLEDQRRREASTSKTTAHKISPNKG